MGTDIQLVVQGDDFGMCHAVNTGTLEAFTDGVLQQASCMVACPWFAEAAEMARTNGIPVGVHLTLTCEWDYLRWSPLTAGQSLCGDDRTFVRTVPEAQAADTAEATAELEAQVERFIGEGLKPSYFDIHMGFASKEAYTAVCDRFDVPFTYPGVDRALPWTSIKGLSDKPNETKVEWLTGWIERLQPGIHLLVCHSATPGEEMHSITSPSSGPWLWAEEYRKGDLAALTDPAVRKAVEKAGVTLTSVRDASW
jgi:chitin disaccharide deacetylase